MPPFFNSLLKSQPFDAGRITPELKRLVKNRCVPETSVDHRTLFAHRNFVMQGETATCHSIALADVISTVAKKDFDAHFPQRSEKGLSTRQLITDYYVHHGQITLVKDVIAQVKSLATIDPEEMTKPELISALSKINQGGITSETFELIKSIGGCFRSEALNSFDEVEELVGGVANEMIELSSHLPEQDEEIERALMEGSIGTLLSSSYLKKQNDERDAIAKILQSYEMITVDFNEIVSNLARARVFNTPQAEANRQRYFEKFTALLCKVLEQGPVILGGRGHAIVLAGYDANRQVFYVRDSLSKEGDFCEKSSKELVQCYRKIYLVQKKKRTIIESEDEVYNPESSQEKLKNQTLEDFTQAVKMIDEGQFSDAFEKLVAIIDKTTRSSKPTIKGLLPN